MLVDLYTSWVVLFGGVGFDAWVVRFSWWFVRVCLGALLCCFGVLACGVYVVALAFAYDWWFKLGVCGYVVWFWCLC